MHEPNVHLIHVEPKTGQRAGVFVGVFVSRVITLFSSVKGKPKGNQMSHCRESDIFCSCILFNSPSVRAKKHLPRKTMVVGSLV